MRRMVLLAMMIVAAGCGDHLLGPVTTLDGQWSAIQNGYSMSLSMVQTGESVTGQADLGGVGGFASGAITGTFVAPNVDLTITIDGATEPVKYTGTLSTSAAKINGKLNGSGFKDLEIDVAKK